MNKREPVEKMNALRRDYERYLRTVPSTDALDFDVFCEFMEHPDHEFCDETRSFQPPSFN
jgi:hypothetical protein